MPPAHCPGIGMKLVSDPFPRPVVDITIAENHLLVRVFHPVNDRADLLFQVYQPVDLRIDFLLQFPHPLKPDYKGCFRNAVRIIMLLKSGRTDTGRGGYGRTKKSHEYCFWLAKGDSWEFNMDPIRKPYSKDMQKYLQGKGKGDRNQNTRPSTHNFDCEKTWTDNGGSDPGTVIEIANTSSNDYFMKLCRTAITEVTV